MSTHLLRENEGLKMQLVASHQEMASARRERNERFEKQTARLDVLVKRNAELEIENARLRTVLQATSDRAAEIYIEKFQDEMMVNETVVVARETRGNDSSSSSSSLNYRRAYESERAKVERLQKSLSDVLSSLKSDGN